MGVSYAYQLLMHISLRVKASCPPDKTLPTQDIIMTYLAHFFTRPRVDIAYFPLQRENYLFAFLFVKKTKQITLSSFFFLLAFIPLNTARQILQDTVSICLKLLLFQHSPPDKTPMHSHSCRSLFVNFLAQVYN